MNGEMTAPPGMADSLGKDQEVDMDELLDEFRPHLMGQCASVVRELKSAKAVVDELVDDAVVALNRGHQFTSKL